MNVISFLQERSEVIEKGFEQQGFDPRAEQAHL